MEQRTCTRCDGKHKARGFCSRHYSEWQREQSLQRETRRCEFCGDEFTVRRWEKRRLGKTCSKPACHWYAVASTGRARTKLYCDLTWSQCPTCQRWDSRGRRCSSCPDPRVVQARLARVRRRALYLMDAITTGVCRRCGGPFVARKTSRQQFCSKVCGRRAVAANRKHLEREAGVLGSKGRRNVSITIGDVAGRYGWRCALCSRPVDRTLLHPHQQAATIDHILPISLGGRHEWANVQLAHHGCNRKRGAPSVVQMRLVG